MNDDDDDEKRHILADPVRLLPAAVSLYFIIQVIVLSPISTSPFVNIAAYLIVFISYLFLTIGLACLLVFVTGKARGIQNYEPSNRIFYFIIFFSVLTSIATSLALLDFFRKLLG